VRETRDAYRVSVWKPGGKRSFGISRQMWEDNIKVGHKEVG
jgi:hypothetical protein